MDVGEESIDASGYDEGPPTVCIGLSGVADKVVVPPPLDGRPLNPVGLQTLRSRTKIGLSAFLPSAMIARPLNSLPLRCSTSPNVSRPRSCDI